MAVQLVKKSEKFARSLIHQGKINDSSSWSFSAADGNKLLGDGNWENYAKWHLGKDTDANKETKAYYKYPFGKNGKVYMSALRAIRTRAAQAGATTIFDAAGRLLNAAKAKLDKRGITMKKEIRSYHVPDDLKIRAKDGEGSDGIFEGYAVVWDSVDSHGTRFKKGSFTKTLQERADKVKVLYNHLTTEPIGKPLELLEDEVGLFVRAQLTEGVQRADETRLNIEAEVLDTLSFGFQTIDSKRAADKVTDITEVKLYEISPVTFASNEKAKITGIRSEDMVTADNDPDSIKLEDIADRLEEVRKRLLEGDDGAAPSSDDDLDTRDDDQAGANSADDPIIPQLRATDFDESALIEELYEKGQQLNYALRVTLSDIWWADDMDNEATLASLDTAISKYHAAYLNWSREFIGKFWEERHSVMQSDDLDGVFNKELRTLGKTIETIAAETSFTADELRTLSRGNLLSLESRSKLAELPEPIQTAHQEKRRTVVEMLCNELRSGKFTKAESERFRSLLELNDARAEDEHRSTDSELATTVLSALDRLRSDISGS